MKDLTPEHAELEQQIIETVEAGNVLDETQQHDEAFSYLHQAYAFGKEHAFQGRPRDVLSYYKEERAKRT
ncbi:hypothetical protein [Paenibacillus amylolyticus]|uniref:hypothetical protein n=1 Tax=Paenibacillus amylolyticus TaxID=1451 RepID=UPI003D976301